MSENQIPLPNSFQLPNVVLDYWMARLSETQFKTLLAICRKTWGWWKQTDMISSAQIQALTGFGRNATRKAIRDLTDLKLITCKANANPAGDSDPNTYGVLSENLNCSTEKHGTPREEKPKKGGLPSEPRGGSQESRGGGSRRSPTKHTMDKPTFSKVIDRSMTSSTEERLMAAKRWLKNPEHLAVYEWLLTLDLTGTLDKTLTWWARTYSITRLDEVYREAKKHNPRSIGAYMYMLLEQQKIVCAGRIDLNKDFAEQFKKAMGWHNLEIFDKYGKIPNGNSSIEIDFNVPSDEFAQYLMDKYDNYGTN